MKHVICKFTGGIKNNQTVVGALLLSAQEYNLDVKEIATHFFHEPEGVTSILLLGESHYSVHTFYESDFYMVDLFTCNPDTDCKKIIKRFAHLTNSKIEDVVELDRE